MEKKKSILSLLIGITLILIMLFSYFGYIEKSVKVENNLGNSNKITDAKVEKINMKDIEKTSRTVVQNSNYKSKDTISKDKAESIAKESLKQYSKINISEDTPIKVSELIEDIYEIAVGQENGRSKVKINAQGEVLNIYTPVLKSGISRNYNINVDKCREIVENFLKKYHEDKLKDINITLTDNKGLGDNILEYKLQRIHDDIEVLEEGGSISIDGEKQKIVAFDIKWSKINFEEEQGKRLTDKEAINILKKSKVIVPYYMNNGESYTLSFDSNEQEKYAIDVSKREVENAVKSEYQVKKNTTKSIKNLNGEPKTKEEVGEISVNIIDELFNKKGKSLPVSEIEENGKKLIRCVVVLDENKRYYIEYDSKNFKVINLYKYGYDTKEGKSSDTVTFEKAYKTAIEAIGLIYKEEIKNVNFLQKEDELMNNKVCNFTFNREVNKIKVKDQYISVSVDMVTGEILSIFLHWNEEGKFEDIGEAKLQEGINQYLKDLKGKYTYINENELGKLYYILE